METEQVHPKINNFKTLYEIQLEYDYCILRIAIKFPGIPVWIHEFELKYQPICSLWTKLLTIDCIHQVYLITTTYVKNIQLAPNETVFQCESTDADHSCSKTEHYLRLTGPEFLWKDESKKKAQVNTISQ